MIDLKTSLTVKIKVNGVYTDVSSKMSNMNKDTLLWDFASAATELYVGYSKPIHSVYVNHNTTYGTDSTLSVYYWDGSNWSPVVDLDDDTYGLKRSAFISWSVADNHLTNSVDGNTKYWYKIIPGVDRDQCLLAGIGLVFSDDYELSLIQPYISSSEFLPVGQTSHILTHSAVKNEIMQYFRNKDWYKLGADGSRQDITCWDLLNIFEVKQAASLLAVNKIYMNMSDSKDDIWSTKAHGYLEQANKALQIATLSLDFNNDGKVSGDTERFENITRFMSR